MPKIRYDIKQALYIALGSISLVLGVIGIFVPLLPTTPFLLLCAALYFRSSPRLYQWLIHQRYLGTYIRDYRENRTIPLRAKIVTLTLMWATMLYCIFRPLLPYLWAQIGLFAIGVGVTWHIVLFKTKR